MKHLAIILSLLFLAAACTPESTTQTVSLEETPIEEKPVQEPVEKTIEEEIAEENQPEEPPEDVVEEEVIEEPIEEEPKEIELSTWQTEKMTDVLTGNQFMISDFSGTPVLVEPFAVWCPKCTRQQNEIKKLHDEIGDEIISVALAIDKNEDEETVKDHATRNAFDWNYVIATNTIRDSLQEDYGLTILNPPSSPAILVCPSQDAHFLGTGFKSRTELLESVENLC